MKFILGILLVLGTSTGFADQYDELKEFAKQVPHAEVDQEVAEYIANETNESLEGMRSHYTLALFENAKTGRSWYLLDGYYEMKSGKILFLDFLYDPKRQVWRPIENYSYFVPGISERFMFEAEEICNPYKRRFVGVLQSSVRGISFETIQKFFAEKFQRQPIFVVNDDFVKIIDPTKSARMSSQVMFTLDEAKLVADLVAANISASVIPSGREPSTPELKKTYVSSLGCQAP